MDASHPLVKADLTKRIVAAIIDMVVSALVGLIPFIGAIIATLYWILRDGLDVEIMDRRSIGKKLVKIRPVRIDGQPMDVATSVKRNWMLALGVILWPLVLIPVLGWVLFALLVLPVLIAAVVFFLLEAVLVVTDAAGRRWGDKLAGTQVVAEETSIETGLPAAGL
jgi:uncharacterized RDD family membrane protein YckC